MYTNLGYKTVTVAGIINVNAPTLSEKLVQKLSLTVWNLWQAVILRLSKAGNKILSDRRQNKVQRTLAYKQAY